MMNHSLKSQCNVSPGTIITGKWHHNQYTVLKELGSGANGMVYLAEHNGKRVALKMSDNGLSITSEVNVLKSFAKVQGSALGPSLLDVDDWQRNRWRVSFYVMEYIDGPNMLEFIFQKGKSWTGVLFLQLLSDLEKLHQNGWIFGDLKPENLIVTGHPVKIRCIDVGGTTIQGRAIKEFTEFYDRGYWGLGSRKADPAYDLFAVGMIMINTAYPKRFNKKNGGISQLREAIRQKEELHLLEQIIMNALQGQYRSATEMRKDLLSKIIHQQVLAHTLPTSPSKGKQGAAAKLEKDHYPTRTSYKRKRKKSGWFETVMLMMFAACFYILYIMIKF